MVFIREDILEKLLFTGRALVEAIIVELFLHKKKWLFCFAYNSNKNSISSDLDLLTKSFDLFPANYEILLILGDFNVKFNRTCVNAFCDSSFKSLVKKKHTSFKNPENFHYINFMLTSSPNIFQNSCAIEFGLSDIRKVTATILKTKFEN